MMCWRRIDPLRKNRNDVQWADPNHQAKPFHKNRTSECPKWTGAEFCSQNLVKFPKYWILERDKLWPVGYWMVADILICWTHNQCLESESSGSVTAVRPIHNSIKYCYKHFCMFRTLRGERDWSWVDLPVTNSNHFRKPGIHAGEKKKFQANRYFNLIIHSTENRHGSPKGSTEL